jgi:hypothetical protein
MVGTLRVGPGQMALAVRAVVGIRSVEATMIQELPRLLGEWGVVRSLGTLVRQRVSVFNGERLLPRRSGRKRLLWPGHL